MKKLYSNHVYETKEATDEVKNIMVLVNVTGVFDLMVFTGILFIFRYPTQYGSGVFRASWLVSATHRHEPSQSGREHLTQFGRKHDISYMSSIFKIMTCEQMLSNIQHTYILVALQDEYLQP